jgi:hypothetical protein
MISADELTWRASNSASREAGQTCVPVAADLPGPKSYERIALRDQANHD